MSRDLFGHEVSDGAAAKSKALMRAVQRSAEFRKTPAYREWLVKSRELRRQLKEKYRRQKGAKPVADLRAESKRLKQEREEQKRINAAQVDHKAHVNAWKKAEPAAWFRHQYRNNPEFNAKQKVRAAMRKASEPDSDVARRIANYTKSDKWAAGWTELLGYGMTELVDHLRKTVPKRCSWDDFLSGKLHIDHIVPRSSFDLTQASEMRACWALSNLRLLRAGDNLRKRDKVETLL